MEGCLKLLERKGFNTCGWVSLVLFVSFGLVVIAIAASSKTALQCNPEKSLASDVSTRKYIETQCSLKYAKELNHFMPLHVLFAINFGIVLVFSIIYAFLVRKRVECYADPPSATTGNANNAEHQSQPIMSQAASDPKKFQKNSVSYFVFTAYTVHLIICRIIPTVVFAALLLNASNYPINFQCTYPSPVQTKSTLYTNFTLKQSKNFSTVDCINSVGKTNDGLATSVISVNFLYGTITFIELAYLLRSTWKDDNYLTDMEFCCVHILRKRKKIRKLMKQIREGIPQDVFKLYDDFGEQQQFPYRKLQDMYVNVIIQDGRESSSAFKKQHKNRHETYEVHFKSPQGATVLENTEALFKPNPKTILVVGRPGIGKTLLTKRIFYQWEKQASEFWHDKIVILLRFRTFNNKKKTSLREMLRDADGLDLSDTDFNHVYEYICLNPSNVILIFDGLDELKIDDKSTSEEKIVYGYNEKTHALLIFKQLVKGGLLRGVTVLTTSRPTAVQIYERLSFDRKVEILGFHQEQIKEYVEKFCRLQNTKIWHFIKESPELLSLCYIPVNSYIVCLTLTETIKDEFLQNLQSNLPRTITELYKRAIKVLLFKHNLRLRGRQIPRNFINERLPEDLQEDLNKLKEIARKGMQRNELIFETQSDNDPIVKLSDCGLFNKLDEKQNAFCFLHLTIQEFLTAEHVVDDMKHVESFICDHIDDPRWHLVIQFVAGLIGDKSRELKAEEIQSKRSTENKEIIDQICKSFQEWIPKTGRIDNTNTLLVIKCVHEMQDVHVMESVGSPSRGNGEICKEVTLYNLNIAPIESSALFKYLYYIKNLNKLKIVDCVMEHFGFGELDKLLNVKEKAITDLYMKRVVLTDECAERVTRILVNENCSLTKLELSTTELTDVGVKYLSDAVNSHICNLHELNISFNKVTDVGAKYLSAALNNGNRKLLKLNISCSKLITFDGAKYLSDALKSGSCNLTELNLSMNKLKDKGAKHLRDALESGTCELTKLNISYNKLTDEGVNYLVRALKSGKCKLRKLDVSYNNLSDVGAKYLSDALKSDECKLTKLDVSNNKLTDVSAEYLGKALTSENCKLTELKISNNKLTNVGARYLRDAYESDSCKLTELYLESIW